jgi:hypothetical protein
METASLIASTRERSMSPPPLPLYHRVPYNVSFAIIAIFTIPNPIYRSQLKSMANYIREFSDEIWHFEYIRIEFEGNSKWLEVMWGNRG